MTAYVICDITVTDPERYQGYLALSTAATAAHGGRLLVRGGAPGALEGDWSPTRVVVIEFDTAEQARTWYDSPEYREAREARSGAARFNSIVVEGAPPA